MRATTEMGLDVGGVGRHHRDEGLTQPRRRLRPEVGHLHRSHRLYGEPHHRRSDAMMSRATRNTAAQPLLATSRVLPPMHSLCCCQGGASSYVFFSEVDAIYYMVSTIFGFEMRHVVCPCCDYPHLDKDWFSVHMHQRHLCAGCGKYFRDSIPGIGNPICQIQLDYDLKPGNPKKSAKSLDIRQQEFPGGVQMWGSNPAFVWSSNSAEEGGIHVHVFEVDGETRLFDDTYSEVTIDGVKLDPVMVRTLMAQRALPHIENRIVSLTCNRCLSSEFCVGEAAFTPKVGGTCSKCGGKQQRVGRLRKVVSNPLVKVLENLGRIAPRTPQKHSSGLLLEGPSAWL